MGREVGRFLFFFYRIFFGYKEGIEFFVLGGIVVTVLSFLAGGWGGVVFRLGGGLDFSIFSFF